MPSAGSRAVRLLRYAGLLLLVAMVWYAGPANLARALRESQPLWLLVAWLLDIPQVGLKALRWFLLVRWQGLRFSYGRAVLAYFGSLFVGFLTPGRVGELAKAVTLKVETGVPLAHGLSSVVIDRVFDMYLLLSLGAVGMLRFAVVGQSVSTAGFVVVCVLLALPLALLHGGTVRRLAAWCRRLPLPPARKDWIGDKAEQFATGLAVLNAGRMAVCGALTVVAYLIFFYQCLCCAWALGFTVPLVDLVLLMAATNFLTFIPVSISGLGTREACLAFFLARVSPPQPVAVAVTYGLVMFLIFFVGAGVMGFACWQWAPIGLRRAVQEAQHASVGEPAGNRKVEEKV